MSGSWTLSIHVYHFKWRNAIFSLILLIMTIPTQAGVLGFIEQMPQMGLKNTFTPALILTDAENKTLPLWIAYLRSADFTKFDMGQLYMMIALSILPVVVVYLFLSKFIVKGVTLGSVKG